MYAANWVHAAAWMLLARQGVGPIRLTDRSSTAITSKALTSRRLCWWAKSPRRQAMRSWIRATTCRRTARSGVPFSRLLKRRWAPARAFSSRRKKRGFSIGSPCMSTANSSKPTSIPTSCPVAGRGDGSALAREADVPLAGAAALNGGRLGRALQGPGHDDFHQPHVHDAPAPSFRIEMATYRHLGEGDAVGAAHAAETGGASHPPSGGARTPERPGPCGPRRFAAPASAPRPARAVPP